MKETTKAWLTPAAVALVFAILGSAGSYAVLAENVKTNTASISIITESLASIRKDTIAELEGRKAVLEHLATTQEDGLTQGQQLEYNNIVRRLKALQ